MTHFTIHKKNYHFCRSQHIVFYIVCVWTVVDLISNLFLFVKEYSGSWLAVCPVLPLGSTFKRPGTLTTIMPSVLLLIPRTWIGTQVLSRCQFANKNRQTSYMTLQLSMCTLTSTHRWSTAVVFNFFDSWPTIFTIHFCYPSESADGHKNQGLLNV